MFCSFCGTRLPTGSRFCDKCGGANKLEPIKKKESFVLCYIFGVMFVLLGILPYFFENSSSAHTGLYTQIASNYGDTSLAAFSLLLQFSQGISSLFSFSASALAVYAGLQLLRKDANVKTSIIFCVVIHGLTVVVSAVVCVLLSSAQDVIISLYSGRVEVASAGENLLLSQPEFLEFLQKDHIVRIVFSALTVAGMMGALCLFFRKNKQTNRMLGVPLMLVVLPLISAVNSKVSNVYYAMYGNEFLAGAMQAKAMFDHYCGTACLIILAIYLTVSVLLPKAKRWMTDIPMAVITAMVGIVILLSFKGLAVSVDMPASIMQYAGDIFTKTVISATVILISVLFWFSAAAKNRQPLWLQILLPCLLPIIYILGDMIPIVFLHMKAMPLGAIMTSVLTIFAATLPRQKVNG